MICLDFDWQIDEFMVYCRSTQLRKKRCFLMNKPCDYLRRKHILSVKTVVMCFLFLRFGLCFDEENEDVLPGRTVFADTRGRVSLRVLSLLCHHPFSWIVIDVFPGLVIILLVADHMIVISGLPDVLAVFLVAKPFECSHKSCNHRCSGRRDTPPGVSDLFVD